MSVERLLCLCPSLSTWIVALNAEFDNFLDVLVLHYHMIGLPTNYRHLLQETLPFITTGPNLAGPGNIEVLNHFINFFCGLF